MKKIILILLALFMMVGCGSNAAPQPSPNNNQNNDYDTSKLSFEEFDEFYAQLMYEGLPEDRLNLALGNANGTWKYDLKIRRDSSTDGYIFDEIGFAEMTVDNDADPRIQIALHPRLAKNGDEVYEETDEEAGYEPFGGDFDENRVLKLTGNDSVLVVKKYYQWQGREYLYGTMWFSEEESGDFMMIRGEGINNDPEPVVEDEDREYSGNSKAFTASPCEAITVSAEAGAFEKDTVIKITSLEAVPEQYAQIEEDLMAQWIVPVCVWEVDAGLKDNEIMPGCYEVEIDLEKLGIDPDFWPAVSIARVDDEGNIYEYAVNLNDNKLTYVARQNSFIMATLTIGAAVYRGAEVIDYFTQTNYFRSRHDILGRFIEAKTIKTDYGTYEIWWSSRDYMPDDTAKLDRIHEIELKYENEAKEYRKVIKNASELEKNKEMANYYKNLLNNDEEYLKLKQEIKLPDAITETIKRINIAYNYLGGVQRIRMPFTKVVFEIRADGYEKKYQDKLGEAGKQMLNTVVSLWPHKAMGSEEDRDNYLLTITHELFHVCQERYRLSAPIVGRLTDDPRFDEMVTMVLERDAKKYYQDNGVITTDPNLTDKINWDTLRLPIDKEPDKAGTSLGNTVKMREGYLLGDFVMYLQQQFPKALSNPHALMKSRSFLSMPTISASLMSVFGLTEAEFDTYFRKWLISKRDEIIPRAVNCFYEGAYYPKDMIKIKSGGHYHTDLDEDGSYFLSLRGFQKNEQMVKLTGVLIPDEDFRKTHSSIHLMIMDNDTATLPKGTYLGNITNLIVAEVYGNVSDNENMKVGYTLWVFDETQSPELKDDEQTLIIKLPQTSDMVREGIVDGYLMTINVDGNKAEEVEIPKDSFETTINYAKSELYKNTDKKQITVSVTLCEFVRDTDGNRCMGRASDPAEITISKSEEQEHGGNTEAYGFSNLYLYKDATCYLDGDVIDTLLDNPDYNITSWPNSNQVIIDGDKITIILSAVGWSFTGADLSRDISEATVTYTRDEIRIYGELMNAYADNRSWYSITNIDPGSFVGSYVEVGKIREGTYHGPGDITYEYVGYRNEQKVSFSNMGYDGKIDVQFNDDDLSFVDIIIHGTYKFDSYFKKDGDEYDVQKDSSEYTFTQKIKLLR